MLAIIHDGQPVTARIFQALERFPLCCCGRHGLVRTDETGKLSQCLRIVPDPCLEVAPARQILSGPSEQFASINDAGEAFVIHEQQISKLWTSGEPLHVLLDDAGHVSSADVELESLDASREVRGDLPYTGLFVRCHRLRLDAIDLCSHCAAGGINDCLSSPFHREPFRADDQPSDVTGGKERNQDGDERDHSVGDSHLGLVVTQEPQQDETDEQHRRDDRRQ